MAYTVGLTCKNSPV